MADFIYLIGVRFVMREIFYAYQKRFVIHFSFFNA